MRNRALMFASAVALVALSGCHLVTPGDVDAKVDNGAGAATEMVSATPTPTPTPEGPQTVAEYDLFLQERGTVVANELAAISNGVSQFNSGTITEDQLRDLSQKAFETITEQTAIVKETNVPEGAEDRQIKWLNAASAIENTQTMVTNCLTATDPVCRAIGNTLTPLAEALNIKK